MNVETIRFVFSVGLLSIVSCIVPISSLGQNALPGSTDIKTVDRLFISSSIQSATNIKSGVKKKSSEKRNLFHMHPIGVVHSPYSPDHRPPRQGRLAPDVPATIEIDPQFEEGLEGIEDFDCIYVIFAFDRSRGWRAKVTPPGAKKSRGVFSTRSPNRPCPIGLTVVRLEKREGRILYIKGIDAFEGTPVLDIKPYINSIDSFPYADRNVEKDLGLK